MQSRDDTTQKGSQTESKESVSSRPQASSQLLQPTKDNSVMGWMKWMATPVTVPVSYLLSKTTPSSDTKDIIIEQPIADEKISYQLPPSVKMFIVSLELTRDKLQVALNKLKNVLEIKSQYYSAEKLNKLVQEISIENQVWDMKEQKLGYPNDVNSFCREVEGRIDSLNQTMEGIQFPFQQQAKTEATLDYFKKVFIFAIQASAQEYCSRCNTLLTSAKDEKSQKGILATLLPVASLFSGFAPIHFDEKFYCVLVRELSDHALIELIKLFKNEINKLSEAKNKLASGLSSTIKDELEIALNNIDASIKKIQTDARLKDKVNFSKKSFDSSLEIAPSVLQLEQQLRDYHQQCENLRIFYDDLTPMRKGIRRSLPANDAVSRNVASATKFVDKVKKLTEIYASSQDTLDTEGKADYEALIQCSDVFVKQVSQSCECLKISAQILKKKLEDKKESIENQYAAYVQFQSANAEMQKFELGNVKLDFSQKLEKLNAKYAGNFAASVKREIDKNIENSTFTLKDTFKKVSPIWTCQEIVLLEKEKIANDLLELMRHSLNDKNIADFWNKQIFCSSSSAKVGGVKVPIGIKAMRDKLESKKTNIEIINDLAAIARERVAVSRKHSFFYSKLKGRKPTTSSFYAIVQSLENLERLSIEELKQKLGQTKAALARTQAVLIAPEKKVVTPRTRHAALQAELRALTP